MIQKNKNLAAVIAIIVIVAVTASVVTYVLMRGSVGPARSGLYAITLSDGRIYFGDIASENESVLVLTDVFYAQNAGGATSATSSVSLVKLGNEFHGPQDRMEINRANILFVEPLRPDGKVAKAIQAYQGK